MRPISKGAHPRTLIRNRIIDFTDYVDTNGKTIHRWAKAKEPLVLRCGAYCAFCDRNVAQSDFRLEHAISRNQDTTLHGDWDNFFLICQSCNSSKKAKVVVLGQNNSRHDRYVWPDSPLNHLELLTMAPMVNLAAIIPQSLPHIDRNHRAKALRTIRLYELNKISRAGGTNYDPTFLRLQTLQRAITKRKDYLNKMATLDSIVDLAVSTGYLIVWLYVFQDRPEVIAALKACPAFHLRQFEY
jgi:hypothetical protein